MPPCRARQWGSVRGWGPLTAKLVGGTACMPRAARHCSGSERTLLRDATCLSTKALASSQKAARGCVVAIVVAGAVQAELCQGSTKLQNGIKKTFKGAVARGGALLPQASCITIRAIAALAFVCAEMICERLNTAHAVKAWTWRTHLLMMPGVCQTAGGCV